MDIEALDIDWDYVVERLDRIIDLSEEYLNRHLSDYAFDPTLFRDFTAFRWTQYQDHGYLSEVLHPTLADHEELFGIKEPLLTLQKNTEQFVNGYPANNILLWGSPGGGKATAIKGLLKLYADQGLRLIEVPSNDLYQLPLISDLLRDQPYRFILFCEHLRLAGQSKNYWKLKTVLEGDLAEPAGNILLYATSNESLRFPAESAATLSGEERQSAQSSLECFGIRLHFPPMAQTTYLDLVSHLARCRQLNIANKELQRIALQWLTEGRRCCGRTARQFINDLSGRLSLAE